MGGGLDGVAGGGGIGDAVVEALDGSDVAGGVVVGVVAVGDSESAGCAVC